MFYPDDPAQLRGDVMRYLAAAPAHGPRPKAIIAPHAGYVYSGPIAASVYARLQPYSDAITRVVLLGPSHRVALRGIAAPSVDAFSTPLGDVPLDRVALDGLAKFEFVQTLDRAHAQEHSLEVQLPFLQLVLGNFRLVPLVVGDATPEQVAQVIDALWGGDDTLIVISSDLSHYHSYADARRMDAATSQAIEHLRYEDIGYDDACGRAPISGLLHTARRRGMHMTTLDLRSSGDTAGPRDRVVGYGAYSLTQ
jgi:AmmeMemoRadiSam system protein B